ncbi:RNA polymerase sigma factor [Sphingomonas sp. XXL09]|uniref:RNA polymerase sigma factor n=1 Tax=Sphingomonas sp. XXL09 TaxID=3457787 RepID=UPI00406BCBBB
MREDASLTSLLVLVASSDERAFSIFYTRTKAKVFQTCLQICNDHSASEEVTTDVFRTVWLKAAAFDAKRSSPITWICAIARNRSIDWLRSNSRHLAASIDDALFVIDESQRTHEDAVLRGHYRLAIAAIAKLPEPKRQALNLAFFDELSGRDIALRLDTPVATVKSWIRRGLIDLRREFDDIPQNEPLYQLS